MTVAAERPPVEICRLGGATAHHPGLLGRTPQTPGCTRTLKERPSCPHTTGSVWCLRQPVPKPPILRHSFTPLSPPGALVCGHRVHRKCWDAMLSAQAILPMPTPPMATPTPTPNSLWMLSGQAKDSSADALTPHCPVCRAWQGGESTAAPTSKRWYEQPPRD